MYVMKKITSLMILVFLMVAVFISSTFAADKKEINFGAIKVPDGYSEIASHTPSYSFQLWHYSGGYWGNTTYGIKLMDAEVAEGIDLRRAIEYKHPVTIKTDLPAKVKEYLANGGSIDDILIKFELTNGLKDRQIFTGTPNYSINDNQITISFEPKFAVKKKKLVNHPGMKVHVPTIPEGYGQMVYAMYTPGGKHLGQGTNVEPEDIIDCDGNLREGKMYAYNMAGQPSQQLPGGKIKIGDGTFANGGAVGLEYLFPIKAIYYIQQDNPPDFYPTPEGSTEWQPTYKDPKYCAKTYTYDQGQTEITFPVNLFNQGEEAITDFKAVWYGKGSDPVKGWQGSNPVWNADEMN